VVVVAAFKDRISPLASRRPGHYVARMVPELELVTHEGDPFSLVEAVEAHDTFVLLPFRGHW